MHGEQNNITFWGLAEGNVGFASLHVASWSQRNCASVLQAGSRVHKSHNTALLRSLTKNTSRHKSNVLILMIVAWYSLAGAGACYVLNRTEIVIANANFPPGQHTKYTCAGNSLSKLRRKQATFPGSNGNCKFITTFTTDHHFYLA